MMEQIKKGWQQLWEDFNRLISLEVNDFKIIKIAQDGGLKVYWNKSDCYIDQLTVQLFEESLKTCEETGMIGELTEINGKKFILNKKLIKEKLSKI
jgi:hypothetical protein